MALRRELSWLPTLGGCLQGMTWAATAALPVDEAEAHLRWVVDRRAAELRALFAPGKGAAPHGGAGG